MTKSTMPLFSCTIKRKPGEGYQVTSGRYQSTNSKFDGPQGKRDRAIATELLDCGAQPDPNGPERSATLIRSAKVPGRSIVLVQERQSSGTGVVFRQFWFADGSHRRSWLAAVLLFTCLGFLAGCYVARQADRPPNEVNTAESPRKVRPSEFEERVRSEAERSAQVRADVIALLSQDGIAAIDSGEGVLDARQSITIIPVKPDGNYGQQLHLTTLQAARLLRFLKCVDPEREAADRRLPHVDTHPPLEDPE